MKCPHCEGEGKISKVYPGGSSTTTMGYQDFYNEEGIYHLHNPNQHTTHYSCSQGHRFWESKLSPCPADNCAWGR